MGFDYGFFSLAAELLRENKRMIDKSIREIERERQGLQAQEKKLIVEIKKNAKQGQMVKYVFCLLYGLNYCFCCFPFPFMLSGYPLAMKFIA